MYLNHEEAAEHLKISADTLYKLTHRKEIAYFKIGKLNRFRTEDLDAFIAARRVPTNAELQANAAARVHLRSRRK